MPAVNLVFAGSPLTQPAELVFGASGVGGVVTDANVTGEGTFPALTFESAVALGFTVTGEGTLPDFTFESAVVYYSDTRRPTVGKTTSSFQQAAHLNAGTDSPFQQGAKMLSPTVVPFEAAQGIRSWVEMVYQDAERLRTGAAVVFQDAAPLRTSARAGFENALRTRAMGSGRFQNGDHLEGGFSTRFQDGDKVRAGGTSKFENADHLRQVWFSRMGRATRFPRGWGNEFQNAIKPPAGQTIHDHLTQPPGPEPCYTPSPNLVFSFAPATDGNLLFFCENHPVEPPDGETIVVPVRRLYVILNDVWLRRVEGDIAIPTLSMSMSLDRDSYTWTFNASLPWQAEASLQRNSSGDPVEVEASFNGTEYRFIVETMRRDRAFERTSIAITGRGKMALLDAPYASGLTFANAEERTSQQLMDDVLTLNGVSLGWDVDWNIDAWTVPAGVFVHNGSYITALNAIAQAAGAYIQPVPAADGLRVLPGFPSLATPTYELPSSVITREGIEYIEKMRYNRVIVRGVNVGVAGQVTITGTDGSVVAPMIVDPLITHVDAARQRGTTILRDTGQQLSITLRLPVLDETGIIVPGDTVRYVDDGVTRVGVVRSVNVEHASPALWQTLGVQHVLEPV